MEKSNSAMRKKRGTIVVMDDEEMIRETVGGMLESLGYSVVCTQNGIETLDFFSKAREANEPVGGMILDLTIHGDMGVVEIIEKIRMVDLKLPVLVTSGYLDGPIMENPCAFGFTASICKPYGMAKLGEIMDRFVRCQMGRNGE